MPRYLIILAIALTIVAGADSGIAVFFGTDPLTGLDTGQAAHVRTIVWAGVYGLEGLCLAADLATATALILQQPLLLAVNMFFMISSLWSPSLSTSLWEATQLFALTTFSLYAGYRVGLLSLVQITFWVFFALLLVSILIAVGMPQYGHDRLLNADAWRGVFPQKNALGQVGTYSAITTITLYQTAPRKTRILLAQCATSLMVAMVAIVGSRSASAIVFFVGLPYLFYLCRRISKGPIAGAAIVAWAAIATASLFLIALGFNAIAELLAAIGKDPTLTGRTTLWQWAWEGFLQHPIFGYGYEGYWSDPSAYGGMMLRKVIAWGPGSVHNSWLEVLLSGGLVGLLLVGALWAQILSRAAKAAFLVQSPVSRWVLVFLLLLLAWSMFQNVLVLHQNCWHALYAMILGGTGAVLEKVRKQPGRATRPKTTATLATAQPRPA